MDLLLRSAQLSEHLAVISGEAQVRELIAEFREGLTGIDGTVLTLDASEGFLKLSERQEVFLSCIAQIIVEKQVPLKELSEFLDEKWMPFAFLAITQNDIAHVDLIKEALLRFHLCVLRLSKHSPEDERVEASKIFVDSALDHHIQQMAATSSLDILTDCCWLAYELGEFHFYKGDWENAVNCFLRISHWIRDTRMYEDEGFSPVDEGKLNRFLMFLTPFMDPADVREVDDLQLDWFPIINSVSKSRLFDREGLLEVFLRDIWTKKIPKDVKAKMIRDAHVEGFTKRALEISICLVSSCESLHEMLLRTDAFVYSLLAALSDPSFCDRVFELLNGVKDTIASMEQDPDKVKLIDRYANRLCCILKSPLAWESHMKYGFESAQGDMSVVGRLHLRRVDFGSRQKVSKNMTCLDVLFSYCSYISDDHISKYAAYARSMKGKGQCWNIPVLFLRQCEHLYVTKDYERAIKLIEASFAQLYGQEADEDEIQKKFIQLHQDCCLAYFMQLFEEAPDSDRINGWIDTYEIPDKSLLGRLCLTLLKPETQRLENSPSFSLLSRITAILLSSDKYQGSHSRVYVQMFTDIFMMRNMMLNAGIDYKSDDLQMTMLDPTLIAQIKKFSLHLAVTLSRSEEARSFLLNSIVEGEEYTLLRFLASCLAGRLARDKEIYLDWFGLFAKISCDVSDVPVDGSQTALVKADRQILLEFLTRMYRALSKQSLPFEIAFSLGELCFLQSQFKDALRYYLNGLACFTKNFSRLEQLGVLLTKNGLGNRILASASLSGAHAFCTFFGQLMPRMDVAAARSALEKWLTQPRPPLVETVPGNLGTISCVFDVALLEHAFRIVPETGKAQIIKVIAKSQRCVYDADCRSKFLDELKRFYFRKFVQMHGE